MKHIVIDARESGTSTGRYVDKLIEHMARMKPTYRISVLAKPHRVDYIQNLAPDWNVIETRYKEFSFSEQLGYCRQVKSLRADLVHFPIVQQPAFYRGRVVTTLQDLTTLRFRNPSKQPIVFWIKQRIYGWLNRRVAHTSAHIITISNFVKQDIIEYCKIPAEKITVTYEAADAIPEVPEVVPELAGTQFIMYVGRPMPHKNLRRLIDAFVILQKSHPDLMLALAGKKDSVYEQHADYITKQGIKNVIFTGFISEGQLRWMFENCAVFAFPTLSEGFGLPALEAMVHGAPVASSNATATPEVNGDGAHYFNPLDTQDIAEKIDDLLTNENLRSMYITKGKQRAAQFSWQTTAEQTLAVYDRVLAD